MKKFGYSVEGFYIDLSMGQYSQKCLEKINELCENLSIKLNIFDIKKNFGSSMCYLRSNIQSSSKGKGLKNCAICGVLKKWIMNKEARRLGFKYIATGHNLDDESQTFLINIFKGNPKLSSKQE
jgi:tRNA(Ile)-lysidine synthase TilS/MesJ